MAHKSEMQSCREVKSTLWQIRVSFFYNREEIKLHRDYRMCLQVPDSRKKQTRKKTKLVRTFSGAGITVAPIFPFERSKVTGQRSKVKVAGRQKLKKNCRISGVHVHLPVEAQASTAN